MDELDDAFADFLKEVGENDEAGAGGASPATAAKGSDGAVTAPPPKRARPGEARKGEVSEAESSTSPASRGRRAEVLRKAAYQGKVAAVNEVLDGLSVAERLILIDDADKDDGFAALHLAVLEGHVDVVRLLVRRRADVDLPTKVGDTPLMCAARTGAAAMCKELLHLGADAAANTGAGTAALQARANGHRRIWEMLRAHTADAVAARPAASGAAAREQAAQARRAANAEMVAQAIREANEQKEEEAFWAEVRARRERRQASGEDDDSAVRAAYSAAKAAVDGAAAALAADDEAAALDTLPANVRPHFKLLEISADATESEVRKAYRRLALKCHPDKNPKDPLGAKEKFTKLAVAYDAVCELLASAAAAGVRVAPPASY